MKAKISLNNYLNVKNKCKIDRSIRKATGLHYHELRWLTEEEAEKANRERAKILEYLNGKAKYRFKQNKLYTGELSPGCVTCGEGAWSCIYINGLCTANCFFCPQDRTRKKERLPLAEGARSGSIFEDPKDYVDYLEKFKFKGVGFSGGEPLVVFDKLLSFIKAIKDKFADNMYVWMYTNGDLLNMDKLQKLKKAGLNEIRFNICARNYDLERVALAVKIIDTVTIEIPAVPEDYERAKKLLSKMQRIGVKRLNLHQLHAGKHNYKVLVKRNYSFIRLEESMEIPVLESELTALRLMKYSIEKKINLSINYCPLFYKRRLQGRGYRNRSANFVLEKFEEITGAGFIRRISVRSPASNMNRLAKVLKKHASKNGLWSLDKKKSELHLHPSLLKYVDFKKYDLVLDYFGSYLKSKNGSCGRCEEIKLNKKKSVFIIRYKLGQVRNLTPIATESFHDMFIKSVNNKTVFAKFFKEYNTRTKDDMENMKKELEILQSLDTWEKTQVGFAQIR